MSDVTPISPPPGRSAPLAAGATAEAAERTGPQSLFDELKALGGWFLANRGATVLILGIAAVFLYFYGIYAPFVKYTKSAAAWANFVWVGTPTMEFGRMIPVLCFALFFIHRRTLVETAGPGDNRGLFIVGMGVILYILSVRTVQPRFALAAIPFFVFGSVLFLAGKKAARVILFPSVFLFFMIPVSLLEQATFSLQFIVTGAVGFLVKAIGLGIDAVGTTLIASDGAFRFEVAEGCSGINSLTSMTMLTAAYVHLTQDRLWKKVVIFLCSLLFAIIGNIGRIFTIILVARFYNPEFASGVYHDKSGYIFFPIAVMAMLAFSKLLNLKSKPAAARA